MKTQALVATLILSTAFAAFAESRPIAIQCMIGSEKDAVIFGPAKAPIIASNSKEIAFATVWDLPRLVKGSEGLPYFQPLTPLAFETANAGWELRCSAEPVGDLIRLTGSLTYSEPELTQGVFGEQSKPIYATDKKNVLMTENVSRTVTLHSSISPFQLFAVPGKAYQIKIRQLDRWVRCKIVCDYDKK
jgi:hypothetical protein